MHTQTQLASTMFGVEVHGEPSTVAGLFRDWGRADRFGLVVDAPLGAAGANLLIQAAIASFYDYQRENDAVAAIYPEIYIFNLERMRGDLSSFDAWPPYKEVLVEDAHDLAERVAERGITWLAVPDGAAAARPGELTHEQEVILNTVRFRLRGGFVYGKDSRVGNADVQLWSADPTTEENLAYALDPALYVELLRRDFPEFGYLIPLAEGRVPEVDLSHRLAIAKERRDDGRAAGGREFYRRLSVSAAIAALPTPRAL